jgi:AcrR family transcriptional regulator
MATSNQGGRTLLPDNPDPHLAPAPTSDLSGGRQAERSRLSTRRLLRATAQLLVEKGYEGTTLAEIGSRAGYSRGLVTRKFGSKSSLIAELIERLSSEHHPEALAKTVGDATGADAARAVIDMIRGNARDHPQGLQAYYVLTFEALKPSLGLTTFVRERYRRADELLIDAVGAGVETGRLHPTVPPAAIVRMVEAGTRGHAYFWMLDPEHYDLDQALDAFADQVERVCLQPAPMR